MRPEWFAGESFELEQADSISAGMNAQLWPIYDGYVIDGDAIRPRGNATFYFPMSAQRLPFELAKIPAADQDAAIRFVSQWGLLGRAALVGQQAHRGEDTLPFIWGHALTIRNVLHLYKALHGGRQMAIDAAVKEIVRQMPKGEDSEELIQCWARMEGARGIVSAELKPLSSEDLALKIIADSITKNLEGTHPVINTHTLGDDEIHESKITRLEFSFRHTALVECAYWRLAMLLSTKGVVAQCVGCGGFFERTDKRQKFCPPTEQEVNEARYGRRKRPQSKCGLRDRTKRHRQSGG